MNKAEMIKRITEILEKNDEKKVDAVLSFLEFEELDGIKHPVPEKAPSVPVEETIEAAYAEWRDKKIKNVVIESKHQPTIRDIQIILRYIERVDCEKRFDAIMDTFTYGFSKGLRGKKHGSNKRL